MTYIRHKLDNEYLAEYKTTQCNLIRLVVDYINAGCIDDYLIEQLKNE